MDLVVVCVCGIEAGIEAGTLRGRRRSGHRGVPTSAPVPTEIAYTRPNAANCSPMDRFVVTGSSGYPAKSKRRSRFALATTRGQPHALRELPDMPSAVCSVTLSHAQAQPGYLDCRLLAARAARAARAGGAARAPPRSPPPPSLPHRRLRPMCGCGMGGMCVRVGWWVGVPDMPSTAASEPGSRVAVASTAARGASSAACGPACASGGPPACAVGG
jgi:hypothetical protein